MVRKRAHLDWARDELDHVSAMVSQHSFVVDIHVTDDDPERTVSTSSKEHDEAS
jgi:hypothetical protein